MVHNTVDGQQKFTLHSHIHSNDDNEGGAFGTMGLRKMEFYIRINCIARISKSETGGIL